MNTAAKIFLILVGLVLLIPILPQRSATNRPKVYLSPYDWKQLLEENRVNTIRIDPQGNISLNGNVVPLNMMNHAIEQIKASGGAILVLQEQPGVSNAKQASSILNIVALVKVPVKLKESN